jgi:hypothetical protein
LLLSNKKNEGITWYSAKLELDGHIKSLSLDVMYENKADCITAEDLEHCLNSIEIIFISGLFASLYLYHLISISQIECPCGVVNFTS